MTKLDTENLCACGLVKVCNCGLGTRADTEGSIAIIATDPDIREILKWLDFKSCGWSPEEKLYRGARKLLACIG